MLRGGFYFDARVLRSSIRYWGEHLALAGISGFRIVVVVRRKP